MALNKASTPKMHCYCVLYLGKKDYSFASHSPRYLLASLGFSQRTQCPASSMLCISNFGIDRSIPCAISGGKAASLAAVTISAGLAIIGSRSSFRFRVSLSQSRQPPPRPVPVASPIPFAAS